jgi:hypothetical protein
MIHKKRMALHRMQTPYFVILTNVPMTESLSVEGVSLQQAFQMYLGGGYWNHHESRRNGARQ